MVKGCGETGFAATGGSCEGLAEAELLGLGATTEADRPPGLLGGL
jgi:hypothetical protein